MRYILGIDQGSSKTHAIIGDERGRILGVGKSRGACHVFCGLETALAAVAEAADLACKQSGLTPGDMGMLVAGMTGIDWDYEEKRLAEALYKVFRISRIEAVNDAVIALSAGTRKSYGCVLCAGSGLNCVVKKNSETKLVYGYYIGKEHQGGFALSQNTIKAVLDSRNGLQKETFLTGLLLDYFHVTTVDDLLRKKATGAIGENVYLDLPILLAKAAGMNDEVSLGILADYGIGIAEYVIAGMRRLDMLDLDADVILSGGIFKCKIPVLRDAVAFQIHKHATNARIVDARYEPVVGALLLGIEKMCGEISPDVHEAIENGSSRYGIKRLSERSVDVVG